ncbi:Transcriptional regulator TetR family [Patulibacter medicamentivorans]|uniref:Transcriptional regulator TetR family n=1 Tax=Patulibacter medicamentivorans TaxID=1097667 RepID=H0E6M0_9ACTN|nr:TetR/AcrR family transcriptional regulator [Patulibacter medicamentivorans]EHN10667.1 Transcriptional regulator TetR family [Patulibacter medicamentivorans]
MSVSEPGEGSRAVELLELTAHERRQHLIRVATEIFPAVGADGLTLDRVATASGAPVSLVRTCFPTADALLSAGLAEALDELGERLLPFLNLPPSDAARRSVLEYVRWAEERRDAFRCVASAGSRHGIGDLVAAVRAQTVRLIVGELHHPQVDQAPAALRIAVTGWLSFASAAILARAELGAPDLETLADQLVVALAGAIRAAGDEEGAERVAASGPAAS